jgi:G:T-mismatch repair DNA endonuclease (very short patch repair protein)
MTRVRMIRQKRSNTCSEIALRRELYLRGLRYRIDLTLPLKGVRRRADVVFTACQIAVFVDGCYLAGMYAQSMEHGLGLTQAGGMTSLKEMFSVIVILTGGLSNWVG